MRNTPEALHSARCGVGEFVSTHANMVLGLCIYGRVGPAFEGQKCRKDEQLGEWGLWPGSFVFIVEAHKWGFGQWHCGATT